MKEWLELVLFFDTYWAAKTRQAVNKNLALKEAAKKEADNALNKFNEKCRKNNIEPGQAWMIMLADSSKWDANAAFEEFFS